MNTNREVLPLMLCPGCGHLNDESGTTCAKCLRRLPDFKNPPRISSRLLQIQEKIMEFSRGQLTQTEMESFLASMEEHFFQKLEDVEAIPIPPEMKDELETEMNTGILGIETFIKAVNILRHFARSREMGLMEEGMAMARKANDMVNSALALNWKSYDSFRDSMEEYLRTSGLTFP
ncbi:MAG: hypothetical protein RDV48_18395 [Candidatus Eremiobacteraeota bacterium]|nr:hypothetical protein [Candidatus Eremiobacteraeota bacterium]